jgi:GGDEF domain-containing protein
MYQKHCTSTSADLLARIRQQEQRIAALVWNDHLGMLNAAGLQDAIDTLPAGDVYTVIFADINRLKDINRVTGSHIQTNRYLRDGLRVRRGEVAGQLYGDEFIFILPEGADAAGFCARITRQLASQPLSQAERMALEVLDGPGARLSATFAWEVARDVWAAVERLSRDVLAQKAKRDGRRA